MRKKTEPPVNFAAKLSEAEWLFRGSLTSSAPKSADCCNIAISKMHYMERCEQTASDRGVTIYCTCACRISQKYSNKYGVIAP
jgi:hypothetical protein